MKISRKGFFVYGILILILIFIGLVFAIPPTWQGTTVNYTTTEDSAYFHNLTLNITNFNNDVTFAIDTETNINWTNSSGTYSVNASVVSAWLSITNSSTGNLTINATYDNQTGFFIVPIQATNTSGGATVDSLEFMVNATNDAPNFTNINTTYNFTVLSPLFNHINLSDEEAHYPLIVNITFNNASCTHASGTPYVNNQNCSLIDFGFNLTHPNNISALLNFTPTSNHVGVYYANISLMDAGINYPCPHAFCTNATYKVNKTIYYSSNVTFNVLASLNISITNCQNKIFQENQAGTCNITITTKGATDSINISSYAILRNYAAGQSGVSNTSWFKANSTNTATNFVYNITINITPQKTEIGNWTINLTVNDTTYSETSTSQIYVYVNRTANDIPDLASISNVNASISLETVINLTVYDDDLLIPDKNSSFGGYNETINFTRFILNRSNLSQQLSLSNFSITRLQMPSSGTNMTTAEIRFTLNSSDVGSYTINVSVNDSEVARDSELFNLTVLNNSYPYWNSTLNTTFIIYENNITYLNFSQNVTDPDGNTLTFSYTNDTPFSSFSINSNTGIVNFTAIDADVGQHIVNITISDGYLTNTTSFNFTIYNLNDNPAVSAFTTLNATPSSVTNGSTINLTEDNYTTFTLTINDDDLRITSEQKSFYNESITINSTIVRTNGTSFNLFNFTSTGVVSGNSTQYQAIFTPNKSSVGTYNITLNITDNSSASTIFVFYLNISTINHYPILSTTTNQSSGINRTLYYDLNVTDTENGNDTSGTNTNFTFRLTNLSGNNIFLGFFNTTTGIFNITFNSSHVGSYRVNVTVNDTLGLNDSEDFWIFVYGTPNVTYPSSGAIINLTENVTSVMNFTANHTVGDNLTYAIYIDGISCPYQSNSNCNYTSSLLRNLTNYYGNGTSYNFSFRPNFTDETYGLLKNLTLVVYPNSSNLTNAVDLNTTVVFKLNITHTNSPISFSGQIADQGPVTHDNDITINLANYFSDSDFSDSYYAQSATWTRSSNGSVITSSVSSSWILTLSSSSAVSELMNITGADASTNSTSNSFFVTFTEPVGSSSSSSSGGGSSTINVPVSLKIIMPDPVSAFKKDRIVLPITLMNDGEIDLYGIKLTGSVAYNGSMIDDLNISFTDDNFAGLSQGQKQNTTMIIEINTDKTGTFEINVEAKVDSPVYTDIGKMFLTIKEGESIQEKIIFTEEFIASNPECIELTELVNEAKELSIKGDREGALSKADQALTACKEAITQYGKSKVKAVVENKLFQYLLISTIGVFAVGISFYAYKRMKLIRQQGKYIQEDIKNKRYLR